MLFCDFLVTMMPLDDKVSALLQYCGTFVIYVIYAKNQWLQAHGMDLFAEQLKEKITPLANQADVLLVIVDQNLGQL